MPRITRYLVLFAVVLAIGIVFHGCRNNLSRYLKQLQPGMSREDTEHVVPSRLLQLDNDPVTIPRVGTMARGGSDLHLRQLKISSFVPV